MAHWQAYLGLDATEAGAIHEAAAEHLDAKQFGVITEIFEDGSEGEVEFTLDVNAESLGGAMAAVAAQWAAVRSSARLEAKPVPLSFVVGPIDEPAGFHQALLARARRAVEPGYSVIVAQTAFEVYIRGLFRDLAQHAMSPAVAGAVLPRSTTLRDRSSGALFAALVGCKPENAGDLWEDYVAHAKRRHGVVHEGAEISQDDARISVRAVDRLIRWIEREVTKRQ